MIQSLRSDKHRPPELTYTETGPVPYTVTCLPPTDGTWSLAQLDSKDPNTAETFRFRLAVELRNRGIPRVYAPSVKHMSAVVVEACTLTTIYELGLGVTVYRAHKDPDLPKGEEEIDGVIGECGDAVIQTGAGCPKAVATGRNAHGKTVRIACHIGRESAIDPFYLGESDQPREYFSAVDSIVAMAGRRGLSPEDMVLRFFFPIPTEKFQHPLSNSPHEKRNKKIYEVVSERYPYANIMPIIDGVHCLSMDELVRQQALEARIKEVSVELVLPINGSFGDTRHSNPILRKSSNLQIVQFT